jgi:hypothetical protein
MIFIACLQIFPLQDDIRSLIHRRKSRIRETKMMVPRRNKRQAKPE